MNSLQFNCNVERGPTGTSGQLGLSAFVITGLSLPGPRLPLQRGLIPNLGVNSEPLKGRGRGLVGEEFDDFTGFIRVSTVVVRGQPGVTYLWD